MTDFAPLLDRMIAGMRDDPARARKLVYDLARLSLERQISRASMPAAEAETLKRDLEAAIETVEAAAPVAATATSPLPEPPRASEEHDGGEPKAASVDDLGSPSPADARPASRPTIASADSEKATVRRGSWRRFVEIAVAAVVPVMVYALLVGPTPPRATVPEVATEPPVQVATGTAAPPQSPTSSLPFPLPEVYGVYAVQNDRLTELDAAQAVPVDPRVKSVLQITSPTKTVLSGEGLSFLIFRREMLTGAPEKVPIRIAAKLARMMTFDMSGKAVTAPPPEERWIIRETGVDYRVRPLKESQEMVLVQPDEPGFALPPGRYALMVNGIPYDVTIDGKVTSPAHCLESVATARGPTIYECRPQ